MVMFALAWNPEFNLGEFLGIGLSTTEIGYLASAFFSGYLDLPRCGGHRGTMDCFALFGLPLHSPSAHRHFSSRCSDFPSKSPTSFVRGLNRIGSSVPGPCLRFSARRSFVCRATGFRALALDLRVVGLVLAGVAVWLAAGWFADEIPSEVRPWTANTVIARGVIVLALASLAVAFWARRMEGSPHARWANRARARPPWQSHSFLPGGGSARYSGQASRRLSCNEPLFFWQSSRPARVSQLRAEPICSANAPRLNLRLRRSTLASPPIVPARPLPVALLLDERDRPVAPKTSRGHSDPIGG